MRALPLLISGLLSVAAALSERDILDIASSQASLDLSNGAEPIFHVVRTDRLVDTDQEVPSVLAERVSHVLIKVQLDAEQSALRIGDQLIPLMGNEAVQVVKSDAIMVSGLGDAQIREEQVAALASAMSPGIVSLEVRVVSELVDTAPAVTAETSEGDIRTMIADNMRFRRVGVFIKINEVEGLHLAHSTTLYAPLLQLLVTTNEGNQLVAVKTILDTPSKPDVEAMPGYVQTQELPPFEEAAKMLPADFRPVPTADEMPEEDTTRPHGHRRPHQGFMAWLAGLLGLDEQPLPNIRHHVNDQVEHEKRPCPKKFKQGLAAAGAETEPKSVEDLSIEELAALSMGMAFGSVEDAEKEPKEGESTEHHRHRHGHHRHGHRRGGPGCFFRRTVRGARKLFRAITSSATGTFLFQITVFATSFTVTRAIMRCRERRQARRERAIALHNDEEIEKRQLDSMTYIDELPQYQEVPPPVVILVDETKS